MPDDYPFSFVPEGVTVHTVSQVTEELRAVLEEGFSSVWLEGEISNFAKAASGHLYFSLRDQQSVLKAAMWRGQALRLPVGFDPRDGDAVIALGKVSFYRDRGDLQFYVERMYPKGLGAAERALRELKEKLQRLGYFDPRRKRPLPRFPRSLCVITSAHGAAIRDILEILRRRWPATRVAVRPSRIQGDGAAEEMAAAIEQVNRWKSKRWVQVDAIIIGRGGGSAEDLGPFDREVLAQAIFNSKIPIISAVGHEIDVTIADLVADVRAATPSHAAEMAVPDRAELIAAVDVLGQRLNGTLNRMIQVHRRHLDQLANRRVLRQPLVRIRDAERRLDEQSDRLRCAVRARLERVRCQMEAFAARLESLSPLNVLARGYSLTQLESTQELIRSPDQVRAGDRLVTVVQHGKIVSRVESAES